MQLELKLVRLAALCVGLLGGAVGYAQTAFEGQPSQQSAVVSTEELQRFALVFRQVQESFVDPVSEHALMEAAIRGLLSQLDPHSAYFSKQDLQAFMDETAGQYAGLGVEVQVDDGQLKIVSPIDDTPADKAGLKTGDVIEQIDGELLEGDAAYDGADQLRGPAGSDVELTILRSGESPFKVTLKREVIQIKSVTLTRTTDDFALMRISAFQADTAGSAKRLLSKMLTQKPLKGLVLDLRDNPGGVVSGAVGIADLFLDAGVIVSTRGRASGMSISLNAKPGDLLAGLPIAVLVNAGTASAAEIVAGSLQDHQRGIVIGQQSFGKGSVQDLLPLPNGDGIKLTTARYFTPNGRSIQALGITPDVALQPLALSLQAPDQFVVTEASLARHLPTQGAEQALATPAPAAKLSLIDDYAMHQALFMLRALAIAKPSPKPHTETRQETH
jgi:carboxyl-terminal processing protease